GGCPGRNGPDAASEPNLGPRPLEHAISRRAGRRGYSSRYSLWDVRQGRGIPDRSAGVAGRSGGDDLPRAGHRSALASERRPGAADADRGRRAGAGGVVWLISYSISSFFRTFRGSLAATI